MINQFYRLMVMTRRRHGVFPQPIRWFRNLAGGFAEKLTIHIASQGSNAIAAIITMQHRDKLVYKYGASDEHLHFLGGMPFLLWNAMIQGRSQGATEFDLGRTDYDNLGLSTFKQRLGAEGQPLTYLRTVPLPQRKGGQGRHHSLMKLLAQLPAPLFCAAGKLLYRHAA
jgi:lipid II:glycine glycyltransferase (peptidoglycan interpeptide bridge formation enzyme)